MGAGKKTYAVIRAVYDNHRAHDDFERELNFVLSRKVSMVIIEPESLGECTWRWIRIGNWLHKTAVLCGFSALSVVGTGIMLKSLQSPSQLLSPLDSGSFGDGHPEFVLISLLPHALRLTSALLSAASATAASFYALFWQWDPCCKYQVASSLGSLPRGLTSVVTCNAVSTSNGYIGHHSGFNPSPIGGSNGASPKSSSGYSQAVIQNGTNGARSRPVIVEKQSYSKGPPLRPVVLVYRDDKRRKWLHNSLALGSTLVTGYIVYQWLRSSPA